MRFEEARGKDTPNPSVRKSETGAIDRVELYGPADRRTFSADDAIAWLSNPVTGSSYQVELFEIPAPRSDWDGLDANRLRLYEPFIDRKSVVYGKSVSVRVELGWLRDI